MRLYAKFFICAALVISAALLFSGYLLITYAHERAISREVERAHAGYQYDKFTAQAGLIAYADTSGEAIAQSVWRQLSSDLNGLAAFFTEDKTLLYSELPPQTDFAILGDVADDTHVHQFQTVEDKHFIIVCGKLRQNDVTLYLLIATDISDVALQKEEMTMSFLRVYVVTLLLSMAVILMLSAFMTGPIKRMNKAAAGIAGGRYDERLPVAGGDEIGELSRSFNLMADAIEDKINELSENARQKEDFVAGFAHELKTPLTSVIGYADMLYQKNLSDERVREAAGYILSEGLRLESLSLKLMDLIILKRQDFPLEEIRADELLSGIAGGLKPVFEERKVTLHLKAAPAYVMVEYDLFKTLLLNLIDNAMKAGCGRIDLVGQSNETDYMVSVSDDGRGIPASELKKITEAFYTVDKSRSRRQHGAGLGLSLAARIAEIHGSPLEFRSSEGVGTEVRIVLTRGSDDE